MRASETGWATAERVEVLGWAVDVVTMEEAVRRAEHAIATRETCQHVAINAAKLVKYQHDETLRAALDGCELATADGQAVVWASRLLGRPLPERVAGIDLMEALLGAARSNRYRVFLLGARPDVVDRAQREIESRFPGIAIAGVASRLLLDGGRGRRRRAHRQECTGHPLRRAGNACERTLPRAESS